MSYVRPVLIGTGLIAVAAIGVILFNIYIMQAEKPLRLVNTLEKGTISTAVQTSPGTPSQPLFPIPVLPYYLFRRPGQLPHFAYTITTDDGRQWSYTESSASQNFQVGERVLVTISTINRTVVAVGPTS